MLARHVAQHERAGNVVPVVLKRFLHAFSHGLEAGKVDDGVYVVSIEHLGKGFPVEDVHLIESKALARFAGFGSRDGAHAIDGHFAGIAQVVNDDDTVALVQ